MYVTKHDYHNSILLKFESNLKIYIDVTTYFDWRLKVNSEN